VPRSASFDEGDISDKPGWVQEQATRLTSAQIAQIDSDYRGAQQALLAVEEAMDQMLALLDQLGETANTYILFTSDNGLHRGEHRIPGGKQTYYEESARIPLFVRGPNVPAGRALEHVVGHVDLAPTVLALAGATIPGSLDGTSLTPLLGSSPPTTSNWRQEILIEAFGGGAPFRIPTYAAVRTATELYMENARGDSEYYDLRTDPLQLDNAVRRAASATIGRLSARVAALRNCAGAACRS
jgi:arylsulfatase A-like enzyme